jgi:prolyl 4-hydroxylase
MGLSTTATFTFRIVVLSIFASFAIKLLNAQDTTSNVNPSYYKAYDDASWAVMDNKLSNQDRQNVYDRFMNGCREMAGPDKAKRTCDDENNHRMQMNMYQPRSMNNFTSIGFKKVTAPSDVMKVLTNFWETNHDKATIEFGRASPYHNTWETEPSLVAIQNESLVGGGYALRSQIANYIRSEIEKWTGMKQAISSVYGIRSYHRGAILAPHVDRLPLVSSAILNVAQDVDEDWPLEVYDHDGIAHNITMKPGDLVLYESHSVIHGRPFALNGKFYANVFVHFEPLGPLNATDPTLIDNIVHDNITYPPYVIPGSSWDPEWKIENPNGWDVLEDTKRLVQDGDLSTIQYASTIHPSLWNGTDEWTPIHEAVRHSHYEIVQYLVETLNVELTKSCTAYQGTPYKLSLFMHGIDHPITQYLQTIRGNIEGNDIVHVEFGRTWDTEEVEEEEEEGGEEEEAGEEDEDVDEDTEEQYKMDEEEQGMKQDHISEETSDKEFNEEL